MLSRVGKLLAAHRILRLDALDAFCQCFLALLSRTLHELFDVNAADRDGKKADCRQNRVPSAHIVGHDESLVALLGCKRLECALCLVGRGVNPLARALFAILLFEQLFENTERNRRLGRRAGLRDDVHGEIAFADHGDDLRQRVGRNTVSGKINVRGRLLEHVVVRAL